MTMIAGPVTVDAARLAYLERVEKAAAHELLTYEAVLRHGAVWSPRIGRDHEMQDQWDRTRMGLQLGYDAARMALHAQITGGAARPEGEEQPGGD